MDKKQYILETFHGPTITFKDFGSRFMAKYLDKISDKNKKI